LKRININNIREIKADVLKELLNALKENTTVEVLEMANVGMTDSIGRVGFIFFFNQENILLSFSLIRSLQNLLKRIQH
jgi:hypothetical protein